MLRSLYIKLNDQNDHHKKIIDFFDEESKKLGISKIKLLMICIDCYKAASRLDITNIQ